MSTTPTDTSTLDLSSEAYKLDFVAAANHGQPLLVVFEAAIKEWRSSPVLTFIC
jgi:hypothetical protein